MELVKRMRSECEWGVGNKTRRILVSFHRQSNHLLFVCLFNSDLSQPRLTWPLHVLLPLRTISFVLSVKKSFFLDFRVNSLDLRYFLHISSLSVNVSSKKVSLFFCRFVLWLKKCVTHKMVSKSKTGSGIFELTRLVLLVLFVKQLIWWDFREVSSFFSKKYFAGSEAVDWLVTQTHWSRDQCVVFCQMLMEKLIITHVCEDQPFRDGYFFYIFRWVCEPWDQDPESFHCSHCIVLNSQHLDARSKKDRTKTRAEWK